VFLTSVRVQWQALRGRVSIWVNAQIRHAASVALTLKWFVVTYLPRQLGLLAASVKAWTADLLARLEAKAVSLFNSVMKWAGEQIQKALGLLSNLRTWAVSQISSLFDIVGRLAKQVFGVLSTPERLADWIVSAMWDSLVKFAKANTHRVEALIVSQRATIWRMVISVIEEVMTELL
jgi:hypothetical protein